MDFIVYKPSLTVVLVLKCAGRLVLPIAFPEVFRDPVLFGVLEKFKGYLYVFHRQAIMEIA